MRSLSRRQRFTLRVIGPGLLLAVAAGLPGATAASNTPGAPKHFCEIPYVCERDTNRGGSRPTAGPSRGSASGGTSSSPTGDTSSAPTGDTSSAPTGD